MLRAVLLVYSAQDAWWIDLDSRATGPFSSRAAAIAAAVPLAKAATEAGRAAEVLAPDDDGRHHRAWPAGNGPRQPVARLAG